MTFDLVMAAALAGIASTPHCAGMCGPLAAAGCAAAGRPPRDRAGLGAVLGSPALGYHAGRLASYAFVGALAGHASYAVLSSLDGARFAKIVSFVVGTFFVVHAALVILRTRRRASADLTISSAELVRIGRRQTQPGRLAWLARVLPRRGLSLGLLTGLLPCGSLVGAALLAASTGNALGGAVANVVFGLATAPTLIAATLVGDRLVRWTSRLPRAARVLLLLGAAGISFARPWLVHHDTTCPPPATWGP